MSPYRPWGLLPWILGKMPAISNWNILACLSTEERCLAAWSSIPRSSQGHVKFIRVNDPSSKYSKRTNEKYRDNHAQLVGSGGHSTWIEDHQLKEPTVDIINSVTSFINDAKGIGGNIILDITSFPKRFFFPAIRELLHSTDIPNILVTNTRAGSYTKERLAEEFEEGRYIVPFSPVDPDRKPEIFIVGMGFETLGLQELLSGASTNSAIKLFFPFPPGPPAFHRTWEFVRQIEESIPDTRRALIQVDPRDVSDTFDHIRSQTVFGAHSSALAPYGPKTMSLAMCIFSVLTKSGVWYTQPTIYNPDYSVGVASINGVPEIYAYCLRLGGRDLYCLD
ncbi:MAG TPA: hypothetical protein VF681_04795 [Abditibacteriaceae bacterium]